MKILLHCCCAPCSVASIDSLLVDGHEVTTYFYNPNIHPYKEYVARRDSWLSYMAAKNYDYLIDDEYPLEEWLKSVAQNPGQRCGYCYSVRLDHTAKKAKALDFEAFSSTLSISPYQNHELIKKAGAEAGAKYGVAFYYADFRPSYRAGQAAAKEAGLYMQKYCGCIYSEKIRYYKKKELE